MSGSLVGVPAPPDEVPPASFDLEWNAPAGCSSAEAVEARVAALLTSPPLGEGEARVVADVVERVGGVHMTLTTTFMGAADVREVDSASCETLADATALLLAVSLEPGLQAEPVLVPPVVEDERPTEDSTSLAPARVESRPAVREASVVSAPQPRPEPARDTVSERRVEFYGSVAAGAERGAVQDFTGAVQAGLALHGHRRPWAVEAGGTYITPRRRDGGLYQLGAVNLRGCWTPGRGRWVLLACGGAELGVLRVDSRGLVPSRTLTGPSRGLSASLAALWDAERVGLFGRLEGVGLLERSRTTRGGTDPEVRVAQRAVSLRFVLGARFDFAPPR